ncbi:CpsD/CapB family tyrosine-protein kinase [Telmatobacter sp. DSM 110680]|uniref:CpsD/CapB family tyrosine-protein kinase n=1 Tax=Telmatobacter sp. DSM 110680 TaxID=3036704 RepID=A0AAU7DE28_9BACT
MSQIFDALQRSEAERSGKNSPVAPHAIELLQRAESQASAHRSAADVPDSRTTTVVSATAVAALDPDGEAQIPSATVGDRSDSPMQCEVLNVSVSPESHLVSLPDSTNPASEAFHLLGVRLRHLRRQRPLKKVLVTSTIPQEGKSVVAANLACTLALHTRQKVLLLEGDVRRPTQSKIFGIANRPGICEWLNGDRALSSSMYRLERPGIWIFPAGAGTGNALELLQSGGATAMMEQVMSWFDWVVIDSPPILPMADTSVWTNLADGILIVTRQGITEKRQLKRGLEALGTQKLIGAVLNSARSVANSDYYYRPTNRLPTDDAEA